MKLSAEETTSIAEEGGLVTEQVERMIRLFDVLEAFANDDIMGPRMALVGGTALNAFHAALPRLSLDIDIHYMGDGGSVRISEERPAFEDQALRIMEGKGYSLQENPRRDASGRWLFGYPDMHGNEARLHIDVNYAQRPAFFGISTLSSAPLGEHRAREIPVVDKSEIVGGKLAALVSRTRARDLFDARTIADMRDLDWPRVKLAALVLGAADRRLDWRELSPSSIEGSAADIQENLQPCLPADHFDAFGGPQSWLDDTVKTCRAALAPMFRLSDGEKAFLEAVLDHGVVDARHLDVDEKTRTAIEARASLQSRAEVVRKARIQAQLAEERDRQRPGAALRLASALTERTSPGKAHWGHLRERIEKLLRAADRRQDVSQSAIDECAKGIARRRAEADLRVGVVRALDGELIHEFEARFAERPILPVAKEKAYDKAVREGMDYLARNDVRLSALELAAARLVIASEGTSRADFARDVAKALEFGTVAGADEIRAEQAALPSELAKGTEGLLDVEKTELLQRLYRSFTVSELREFSVGKGPHVDSLQDEAARSRASGTLSSLLSIHVAGPAPWKELHAGLARSRGIEPAPTAESVTATPKD